jgi:hypothetical protein
MLTLLFLCLCITKGFGQASIKKEFIQLRNGDLLNADIKKVRPGYVVARVGPVERKYPAFLVKKFYSKAYNTVFESHAVGRRKWHFLGIFRDGEVIALCELKNMVVTNHTYNPMMYSIGSVYFGGTISHTKKSGFWTLEGKTYFRHISESDTALHVASKKELFACKAYECFPIMIKLLNGLNDMDLSYSIRNQTYRDLIVKYNSECEAKFRNDEEEREKKRK